MVKLKKWINYSLTALLIAGATNAAMAEQATGEELPAWAKEAFYIKVSGKILDTGVALPSRSGVWLKRDRAGYAAPEMYDVNQDGRLDLVVGTFGGGFRIYQNKGSNTEPLFEEYEFLQTDDGMARLWNGCCMGVKAEFVDIDKDGIIDLTASSYKPGGVYWFQGHKDGFSSRVILTDKEGLPVFSGLENLDTRGPLSSLGTVHTWIDLDGDGALDLVMGSNGRTLEARLNKSYFNGQYSVEEGLVARPSQPVFSQYSRSRDAQKPITVSGETQYVGPDHDLFSLHPEAADWDGDGDADLIVGVYDGSVWWFENIDHESPYEFAAPKMLLAPGNSQIQLLNADQTDRPPRGIRSTIDIADYNGDGIRDLLVGFASVSVVLREDLSAKERSEIDRILEELRKLDESLGLPNLGLKVGCRATEQAYRDNPKLLEQSQSLCDSLLPFFKVDREEYADVAGGYIRSHGHVVVYLGK